MNFISKAIRRLMRSRGFDLVRYRTKGIGEDPFDDLRHFVGTRKAPVIFDVGANVGLVVERFRGVFPGSWIHAFEPSPATFEKLRSRCGGIPKVQTWNCGVGARDGTLKLLENDHPDMTSFLSPTDLAWGKVVKTTDVEVVTLDSFTQQHDIGSIDILKSDTQGFEFEVLKGAERLLRENKIGLIYFELLVSEQYQGIPPYHEILRYLSERNYSLVTFYESHYQKELLSWTDALFVNREYLLQRGDR